MSNAFPQQLIDGYGQMMSQCMTPAQVSALRNSSPDLHRAWMAQQTAIAIATHQNQQRIAKLNRPDITWESAS